MVVLGRSIFKLVLAGVAALTVASCSVHPLPDDTTGLSTYQITRQITCETRQAVVDTVIGFLTNPANRISFATIETGKTFQRVDLSSSLIGARLKENPESLTAATLVGKLTGAAKDIVEIMLSTGIAYNYDLLMSELNNNDPTINLLSSLTHSSISLAIAPKLDLQRQNERLFTSATTFAKLVDGPARQICKSQYVVGENLLYPIAGQIGMKKVVQDFIQLAVFGNLTGDETKDFSKASGPVQLAEQLQFTTVLDLTVTPKVTFAPVPLIGSGLHVADTSLVGEAQRKDTHKLTLGLYVPLKGSLDSDRNDVSARLLGTPLGGIVTAPVHHEAAEGGALRVLNQFLVLKLFQVNQVIVQ